MNLYKCHQLQASCLQMFVFQAPVLLLCLCLTIGEPQNNFNRNRNNRRPARQNNNNRGQFLRNGVTRNGSRDRRGTEVYPGCDGKVCLPEASLCAERQNKVGFLFPFTKVIGRWSNVCLLEPKFMSFFLLQLNETSKATVASFGRMSVCQRSQKKLNINSDPFPTQSSDVRTSTSWVVVGRGWTSNKGDAVTQGQLFFTANLDCVK